jgi:CelD/BcsL family acetyltransferase involved in cellulose biosynthesis
MEATLTTPPVRVKTESVSLRVYKNLEELQELQPLWDDLLAAYPLSSSFSTWEWLSSWWLNFGQDKQLRVLALFDSESHLVGLAPLSISREKFVGPIFQRVVRFMGDGSGDSDNLDFVVRSGFENAFANTIVNYLNSHTAWDMLLLNTMPLGSPVADLLTNALKPRRWLCVETFTKRSIVLLPKTWPDYLQQLSNEDRNNFARYQRRLEKRYSTRIFRCTSEVELERCLSALFRLHQMRWQKSGQPGTFGSSERRNFYYDLSRRLMVKGWLELWAIELNGEIAAVQFGLRYEDTVYHLQEGFNPERSSDRVGFILRAALLKELISESIQVYDFLGGEDSYKARWAARASRYRNLHFARSFELGGVVLAGVDYARRAKQSMRSRLPNSIWRLLHKANLALHGK